MGFFFKLGGNLGGFSGLVLALWSESHGKRRRQKGVSGGGPLLGLAVEVFLQSERTVTTELLEGGEAGVAWEPNVAKYIAMWRGGLTSNHLITDIMILDRESSPPKAGRKRFAHKPFLNCPVGNSVSLAKGVAESEWDLRLFYANYTKLPEFRECRGQEENWYTDQRFAEGGGMNF